MTHTPGPWTVEHLSNGDVGIRVTGSVVSGYTAIVHTDWARREQQVEQHANAHLMAAAPDFYAASLNMLDALFGPLLCTHGNEGEEDICDGCAYERENAKGLAASELRAAIAKAAGR